jgi:hypothetical protein
VAVGRVEEEIEWIKIVERSWRRSWKIVDTHYLIFENSGCPGTETSRGKNYDRPPRGW